MFWWTKRAGVSVATVVLACSTIATRGDSHNSEELEPQIFAAALENLLGQLPYLASRLIDPRPVQLRRGPWASSVGDYLDAGEVGQDRLGVIEAMGLDTASIFPLRENCNRLMAPPGYRKRTGCPEDDESVSHLAFGLPYVPDGTDTLAIRAISLSYSRAGLGGTVYEVVFSTRSGLPVFDRIVVLARLE